MSKSCPFWAEPDLTPWTRSPLGCQQSLFFYLSLQWNLLQLDRRFSWTSMVAATRWHWIKCLLLITTYEPALCFRYRAHSFRLFLKISVALPRCLSLPWLPSWLLAFARQQHLFLLTLSWFLQMTLVFQPYTLSSSRQQCYLGVNDVPWNNRDSGLKELGSLAKNGVVLEKAYTLPICTPSRFSILKLKKKGQELLLRMDGEYLQFCLFRLDPIKLMNVKQSPKGSTHTQRTWFIILDNQNIWMTGQLNKNWPINKKFIIIFAQRSCHHFISCTGRHLWPVSTLSRWDCNADLAKGALR